MAAHEARGRHRASALVVRHAIILEANRSRLVAAHAGAHLLALGRPHALAVLLVGPPVEFGSDAGSRFLLIGLAATPLGGLNKTRGDVDETTARRVLLVMLAACFGRAVEPFKTKIVFATLRPHAVYALIRIDDRDGDCGAMNASTFLVFGDTLKPQTADFMS